MVHMRMAVVVGSPIHAGTALLASCRGQFHCRPKSLVRLVRDFCLFLKLRGCSYETIEEMKAIVTKVIDTLTQEDFHGSFQKLLERYKCIAAGGDYFEGD